jgi:hypothetical protein
VQIQQVDEQIQPRAGGGSPPTASVKADGGEEEDTDDGLRWQGLSGEEGGK